MPLPRRKEILLLVAVMAGAMWQLYLVDDGLGSSWPQNVVRNWEQFGLLNLHGRLVTNPGGYEIGTAPNIYAGMSPLCLWPVYLITKMFAWTGAGTLAFHFFLALAFFWGVWELLGRDNFGFLVAAAAVLTPGYDRWQKGLDPNAISVLLGLPYAAIVVGLLKKPRLGFAGGAFLLVLTFLFISLNWTTAWVLGPLALLLIGLPQVSRRSLFLFAGLAGFGSVLFVTVSVLNKAGGGHGGSGNLSLFLRSYLWGDVGYGSGLTTGKAFVLLSFTNGVGLLTVWLLAGTTVVLNRSSAGRTVWLAMAPLAMAVADVVIMRNYFGHHPWMASPVLLAGLIFSLVLLRGQIENRSPAVAFKSPVPPGNLLPPVFCLACFLYGMGVLSFFRANEANQLSLISLIRHHTARSDAIVIVKAEDPQLAQMAARFDEVLDRRVVVVDDLNNVPAAGGHAVILSAIARDSLQPVAQSGGEKSAKSVPGKAASWFNRSIARRKPGDRLELADAYFLYEPKP